MPVPRLGGHQPFAYITHRMIDVGIGVATRVAVNVLVFAPSRLRPAEHAIRQWGNDIARALAGRIALSCTTSARSPDRHDRIAVRLLADKAVHDALTETAECRVCGVPPAPRT